MSPCVQILFEMKQKSIPNDIVWNSGMKIKLIFHDVIQMIFCHEFGKIPTHQCPVIAIRVNTGLMYEDSLLRW